MSKKVVTSIRRTGSASTPVRHIVAVQGTGKEAVETILSTPIEKVQWGVDFRHGGASVPIEQYAFKVAGRTVERFADATAIVLKRHHIGFESSEGHQAYVTKALEIVHGEAGLHEIVTPADAAPAVGSITQRTFKAVPIGEVTELTEEAAPV